MANPEHLELLTQGHEQWNAWRASAPDVRPDLSRANLDSRSFVEIDVRGVDFSGAYLWSANFIFADLTGARFTRANLSGANLRQATLRKVFMDDANLHNSVLISADLRGASLMGANLLGAALSDADLSGAKLRTANLNQADLRFANLEKADLTMCSMVGTDLAGANLTGCLVHGIAAWDLKLEGARQEGLIITPNYGGFLRGLSITVDNLEVAQFIYLLLRNERVRHVIDTITSKLVLILGRFSEERKFILDAVRDALRERDLTPVLFDFEEPASKDTTGTIETLARMARFVIADISDPRSVPHELATIVPFLRTTPVLPLRLRGASSYSMFDDLAAYPWVLKVHVYDDAASLTSSLTEVLKPVEEKVKQLRGDG